MAPRKDQVAGRDLGQRGFTGARGEGGIDIIDRGRLWRGQLQRGGMKDIAHDDQPRPDPQPDMTGRMPGQVPDRHTRRDGVTLGHRGDAPCMGRDHTGGGCVTICPMRQFGRMHQDPRRRICGHTIHKRTTAVIPMQMRKHKGADITGRHAQRRQTCRQLPALVPGQRAIARIDQRQRIALPDQERVEGGTDRAVTRRRQPPVQRLGINAGKHLRAEIGCAIGQAEDLGLIRLEPRDPLQQPTR